MREITLRLDRAPQAYEQALENAVRTGKPDYWGEMEELDSEDIELLMELITAIRSASL